jgi:hypothetical protein
MPRQRSSLPVAIGILLGVVLAGGSTDAVFAISLRQAYEEAGPANGYDKWGELQTGVTYTGGLLIGPGMPPIEYELIGPPGVDVRIVGNGAVLDLQGGQLCISYCTNRLDLDDCVVLNGNLRFRGINTAQAVAIPTGSVRHVTFWRPHDYGIRLQGAGNGITLERNLVVSAIDTGWDWIYTHGLANSWLPTGTNISFSGQDGYYGTPSVLENWAFHEDPTANATPLRHFSRLCEYG